MKILKALGALCVVLLLTVAAAAVAAASPASLLDGHVLHVAIEWYEGVTAHTDGGLMVALATALPAATKELKDKVEELLKVQKTQFEDLEPKIKEAIESGKGAAELKEQVVKTNGEVAKISDQIKALADEEAKAKKALQDRLDEFESKYGPDGPGGAKGGQTLGERFVKHLAKGDNPEAAFEAAYDAQKTGKLRLDVGGFLGSRKEISGAAGSGEDLQDSFRIPGVIAEPNVTLSVQDLIPTTRTNNRTVDFVRELVYTNNAAPHAEQTDSTNLTHKAKSNITFELVSETMRTIAHWVPASRQILRYSNRTQLQNYVDGRLRYGVLLELEDQILLGDDTNQNMNGLVKQATAYNRGYAQIANAAATKLDTLRRAMTQARLAEYPVTGQVLHPGDWEDIVLAKGSDLHYIFANPGQMTTPRLWGVPVADSTRMTEDEFLLGAFALGAELYVGADLTVEVAREHASFFTANMVAILAEMDALLAVYRPRAFVTGPFTEPT